ncbi:hypothetical protein [uncultured Vibrio sp.]|uniref:hypothetical protein n=1 Tax=uncultured Vibrio sp. TaxID=114054 RepID=UPI002AA6FCAE|nr:hypothetical protein [uncultured Vibrio sp.]
MLNYHQIFTSAVTLIVLLNMPFTINAATESHNKQFVQLLPKPDKQEDTKGPLQLGLKDGKTGALLTITFTGEKITLEKGAQAIPPGGMYTVSLDGSIVLQETFNEPTLKTEKPLPMQTSANGDHIVRCELRYSIGKTYQAELPFSFDATPIISLEKIDPSSPSPDPALGLQFYSESQKIIGVIDVAVDERSLGVTQISAQANGEKKPLSKWMGKPISVAELSPGQHLIRLTATGTNGGESVKYIPFKVEAIPVLNVDKNQEGTVESIKATFLQASNAYSGSVNVYYQHGVILSVQSKEPSVLIKKSDIVQAFSQHKLTLPTTPVTLVVGLRSANNTENWQTILFQP